MATTDIYTVTGGLKPSRPAIRCLGSAASDDYIQVDAFAAARVAANDTVGTFTAWVMIKDIAGTYTVIGCGDKNVVEFLELNIEAGLLTARCTDATVAQFVTQADAVHFEPHRWYHVAMVQAADGYGPKLYVNGQKIAATNDTSTDVNEWFNNCDGIDSGRIGSANKAGDDSVTQEFGGYISDVKYWNVALTASQILDDYNGNGTTTSLISHWDFKDDLIDGVAGHNGTNVGSGIILCSQVSEFSSRLSFMTADPVVADSVHIAINQDMGFGLVIQAA